ncbi:hypothetical protein GFB56_12260 [Ensifer sp. T173]|uniref:Twin-arginine translocation signal domain-containing protein n=1 Tax=Ensifer canadensis TaxID=555315 RepID=A0AAW4FHJ1_9HYPH|nr:hypothetical protein [Ensifer canadensis]MBM3091589.1 hypothetical protein [Ensifer canadensis]UBI74426.1 hypothetical protein J3R84_13095 [Ensifer canadensis]
MKSTRRSFLGGVAAASLPVATATANPAPAQLSIDDFLSQASSSERMRYHTNALMDALAEMHPERSWRSHVDHEYYYALIVGDVRGGTV